MTREIDPIGERRERDLEAMVWKPWQPPVVPPPAQQPPAIVEGAAQEGGTPAVGKVSGDRNQATRVAATLAQTVPMNVDVNLVRVPLSKEAAATAHALGELGTVNAIGQVAKAIAHTPIAPDKLSASLGHFVDNLTLSSKSLMALHGVGDALQVFGGVGGVVAGATGLKQELDAVKEKGLSADKTLGIAARAAQLVGGVAMALSPVCPALAPIGATLMTAGSALALGKLAFEHRDDLKGAARKVGKAAGTAADSARKAADQAAKVISNNGASMVANNGVPMTGNLGAAIISNNGATMSGKPGPLPVQARVQPGVGGAAQDVWQWITG